MPDTSRLSDFAVAWMQRHGWTMATEGRAGSMWVNPQLGFGERVGVLRSLVTDDPSFSDLVERLSTAHSIDATKLANEVHNWAIDVTYLRAVNDYVITDSIPLSAGATMLESARLMFRSAATAAVKLRPSINGSFSKLGDQVAEQVRMGHTQRGSYIVPVLVNVGESDEQEPTLFAGDEIARSNVETLERRATRTFAQALNAIAEQVVKPEALPTNSGVQALVAQGVTREFATAVVAVLSEQAVSSIDARFEWAQSQGDPAGVPAQVEIPAESEAKIVEAVRLLRSAKRPKSEIFTGPVVVVAREPEDAQTRFAIRTVRGGRQCRIETTTTAPLAEVLQWMNNGTTLQIAGDVSRSGGSLQIDSPTTVAALVELHAKDVEGAATELGGSQT